MSLYSPARCSALSNIMKLMPTNHTKTHNIPLERKTKSSSRQSLSSVSKLQENKKKLGTPASDFSKGHPNTSMFKSKISSSVLNYMLFIATPHRPVC